MSTSDDNDFARWVGAHFAAAGAFTAFAVLVRIDGSEVAPLCATYFNVIGDDVAWEDIVVLFAGSGTDWDGAAFVPASAAGGGPLDNPAARRRLQDLEDRLDGNPRVLAQGPLFDRQGRRIVIEDGAR